LCCRPSHSPLSPHLAAASSRAQPQLYIKGKTPKPAQRLAAKEEEGSWWEGVVLIRLGKPPIIEAVPTPSNPYPNSVWLSTGKKTTKPSLTGAIYKKIIKGALIGTGNVRDGTAHLPPTPINLLHDRDPAHSDKGFLRFAASYNIKPVLLPPRSPDLDPLDYGVFGPAQRALDREVELRPMDFEQQVSFFVGRLLATDTDAGIKALPGRIQRCIAAKGGHFE
jgi:hypothetical protein